MTIKVEVLKTASEKLFAHLEELGITEIPLDHNYHWVVDHEEAVNPTVKPELTMLGKLSDNYDVMTKLSSCTDVPINYHLVWLASLLDYIGHRTHE